ncbi:MAG: type II toxin-antitoxin system HicA family toxin [Calditrichaeota bacterium]|nr:type II toxin-antitoxin system HicA family toxin [Calditrichota bacterium]
MTKLKIKNDDISNIDKIESLINDLKKLSLNEFDFNEIQKILIKLGCTIEYSKGSIIRIRHEILVGKRQYTDGIFTIHRIHGGKNKIYIRKRDYVRYLFPPLELIVLYKKEKVK